MLLLLVVINNFVNLCLVALTFTVMRRWARRKCVALLSGLLEAHSPATHFTFTTCVLRIFPQASCSFHHSIIFIYARTSCGWNFYFLLCEIFPFYIYMFGSMFSLKSKLLLRKLINSFWKHSVFYLKNLSSSKNSFINISLTRKAPCRTFLKHFSGDFFFL